MTAKSNPNLKIYSNQKEAMAADKGKANTEDSKEPMPAPERIESGDDRARARGDVGFNMYI